MAESGKDANFYQQLNLVFKSLGERGKEAQIYKQYNEHVFSYVLKLLSGYLNKKTENSIMVRPCGSAAEDLKCLVPDDYGDVDVMIFPNADNCLIYDDLLEYSSENPLHVKIKGSDHRVLQSCLVEDTEYVSTSALKNFHPAIYGSGSPEIVDFIIHWLRALSREDLTVFQDCIFDWQNKGNSPAFTIDVSQSLETMFEQMQKVKDAQIWHNIKAADWEWLAIAICTLRGAEYTREHAAVLNDYLQYMGELMRASVTEDGSSSILQSAPVVLQKLVLSGALKNFQDRVQAIESRSQHEYGSRKSEVACHGQKGVTPENLIADESGSGRGPSNDAETCVTPQNYDEVQRPTQDLKYSCFDPMENSRQFSEETMATQESESEGEEYQTGDTKNRDDDKGLNESKTELKKATKKGKLASEDVPRNDNCKEKGKKEGVDRIATNKRLFEHMLGTGTEMKGHSEKEYKRKLGVDLVPALRSRGWPKVAREWIKRDRKWPSPEMVNRVIQEGYHLVVKPPKTNGNLHCDFRISFSHAEFLLSQEINDIQRECYRCLKKYHRAYLSKPAGVVTFHLKNLLLQTIEETGAELWTESNRVECMMRLLGNLLEALTKKDLRHFFVRAYNLFGVDYIEDPKILEVVAREVEKIIESPVEFTKNLIQNQDGTMQVEKEEWLSDSEPTVPVKPVLDHGCEGDETARFGSNTDAQSEEETLTSSGRQTETTQGNSPILNYGYLDLKDIYLQVCKEVIDMAQNNADCNLEALDPLEKSLVEDLREQTSIHGLRDEDFLNCLRKGWYMAYYKVCISTEPDTRRRMLYAIHGQLETWKYILKQEDCAPGNEEAIVNRMLNPGPADDPFDLNHVFPRGGAVQCMRRWINNLDLTLQPSQPQKANIDDIPLD